MIDIGAPVTGLYLPFLLVLLFAVKTLNSQKLIGGVGYHHTGPWRWSAGNL
jgi:hypothetical protein